MELLALYSDSDGSDVEGDPITTLKERINAAPTVTARALTSTGTVVLHTGVRAPPQRAGPLVGPPHPSRGRNEERNSWTGHFEAAPIADHDFTRQFYNYQTHGVAIDPSVAGQEDRLTGLTPVRYVIDKTLSSSQSLPSSTTTSSTPSPALPTTSSSPSPTLSSSAPSPAERKRRAPAGDPSSGEYLGPWAPFEFEQMGEATPLTAEQRALVEADKAARCKRPRRKKKDKEEEGKEEGEEKAAASTAEKPEGEAAAAAGSEHSTFHGTQLRDYQGRSFVHPPSELKPHEHDCFIPKKWLHTWAGHTRGVSRIEFFPGTGHVLLSAGMDGTLKVWDVLNQRQLLRTYNGHTAGCKDTTFSNDGRQILSASHDKWTKLWDTETGDCLGRFTNHRTPNCVRFYPLNDHVFIAGTQDKKIVQFDTRSGKLVQTYDQHLAAVNTVTFIDDARRFVSSSDDKSLRVWEWGIPVVIKYICEPHMHSMPAVSRHPTGKWLVAQSLDNQILVYETGARFKQSYKKRFAGHLIAGYACMPSVSPDGKFVMSGDSEGKLWFWDWKSCKVYRKLRCHDRVTIDAKWHPIEPSRVATASWDGSIKYWD